MGAEVFQPLYNRKAFVTLCFQHRMPSRQVKTFQYAQHSFIVALRQQSGEDRIPCVQSYSYRNRFAVAYLV